MSFKVMSPDPSLKQSANDQHVQIIRGPEGHATKYIPLTMALSCKQYASMIKIANTIIVADGLLSFRLTSKVQALTTS